jgi:catechol 2,3-dioxygenase-like lactoylglutathione lyase family enzyme
MLSLSRLTPDLDADNEVAVVAPVASQPKCYGLTIFTLEYRDVRDFYVNLLGARVIREKPGKFCEMDVAGVPICLRQAEQGEMVSYFHINLVLKRQEPVLAELRRRGIVVTTVGPFTNFRDPEGRVIKLSEERVSIF